MKKLMKMLMAAMAVLAILHCRAEKVCVVTFDANGGFWEDYDEFGNLVCPHEIFWEIEEGCSLGNLPWGPIEPVDSYLIGWFDTNGVEFTESTVVTNDMTVTARWIVGHPWTQEDDGSWRSGAISDGQSSSTELFVVGPAVVSFKWKVSSESYWDKLSFTIDADYRCEISGEMAEWQTKTFTVNSGDHYLSWTYSKDGSMSNGEDCGWVKDIVVTTNILTFTGTLDANGGMFVDGMETHSVENLALFKLPTPRRSNCAFLGWFTAADGGEEVTIETVVTSGTTLYAHWEEIVYTYSYIDNGDGTVTLARYYYDENGNWIYEGISPSPVGEFTVPTVIDGKQVVAIGSSYFSGCYGMISVVIPASVKEIGDYAFGDCQSLMDVTFQGDEAQITIADTAFIGTPYDASKPFSLIIDDYGTLVGFHGAAPENLVIADYLDGRTLTSIGARAISATSALKSVVVPEGVTYLDSYAFASDAALESVTLPTTLTDIYYGAFYWCTSLREIRIPAGVTYIDDYAFEGCENLTVTAPSTLRDRFSVPYGCSVDYYEVPRYTVTFDANGGTVNGSDVAEWSIWEGWTIEDGGRSIYGNANGLPWPMYDNHAFLGWFTDAEDGTEVTADMVVTTNVALYAHWMESPFTRMSEYNPWTPEEDGSWRSGDISDNQSSSAELFVVGPAAVSFKWKVSSERGYDGLSFAIDGDYKSEITGVMAEWEKKTFTVGEGEHNLRWIFTSRAWLYGEHCGWVKDIFVTTNILTFTGTLNANGGVFVDGTNVNSVESCALLELPTPTHSISNYAFVGWFTAADGGDEVTIETAETAVENGMTLYAHWVPYTYAYIDNGDGTVTLSRYDAYRNWINNPINPSPVGDITVPGMIDGKLVVAIGDGYFSGCYDMTSVCIPASIRAIDSYAFDGCANQTIHVPESLRDLFYEPDSCTIDYYEVPKYTLTFDANGGTIDSLVGGGMRSGREGRSFRRDETAIGLPRPMGTNGGISGGSPSVTRTIWEGWTFGDYANVIGIPWPVYDGLVFIGWFTEAEGGAEISADMEVTADMTLYAHWAESPFTRMSEYHPWMPEADGSWRCDAFSGMRSSSAELFVVGPAAVSFKWKATSPRLRFAIDADYQGECEIGGTEWENEAFLIEDDGEHVLRWVYSNDYGAANGSGWVKDIVVAPILRFTGTLDANGGVFVDDGAETKSVDNLALADLLADLPPTRSNHAFGGWFTAAEGGDEVTIETEVTSGMTLYAHWRPYAYSYIDNGDGTVTLSRYDKNGNWINNTIVPSPVGELTIPSTIDGKWVVGIGDSYFEGMSGITSVTIPDGVTNISNCAFYNCSSLLSVSIPSSVEWIGESAFYNCSSLLSVSIPSSVEWIGESAFEGCYNLATVSFAQNGALTEIGDYAFSNCSSLSEITIPSSVEYIGSYAFYYCSDLATVTFAGTEDDIDIHYTAFYRTPYEANKPFSLVVENGEVVGYHGTCPVTLSAGDFPVGVTSIGWSAFSGATSLTDVTIPAGVANIADYAFDCYSLTNVVVPASVMTIGYYAFGYYYSDYYYSMTIYAPSTLRDMFYVPYGCTVDYYDVAEYDVVVGAGGNVVADNGDGSFTITPPAGGVLSGADVAAVTVTADVNGESVNVTDRFSIVLGDGIITVSPKVEIDCMVDVALKDAEDKSGFLVDPAMVTLATEPTPDTAQGETLGALPVKTIPGMWYQASWGDSLDDMTSGAKVQASGLEMYLGVIKQTGTSGFYKVSVSNE